MPLYEYECNNCNYRFERLQKFSDPPASECPSCGGPVSQLLSPPAIQFKGSGWYVTDYAKKSGSSPAPSGNGKNGGNGSSAAPSAESKPAENRTESKTEKS